MPQLPAGAGSCRSKSSSLLAKLCRGGARPAGGCPHEGTPRSTQLWGAERAFLCTAGLPLPCACWETRLAGDCKRGSGGCQQQGGDCGHQRQATGQMPYVQGHHQEWLLKATLGHPSQLRASIPARTVHLKGHLAVQVGASDRQTELIQLLCTTAFGCHVHAVPSCCKKPEPYHEPLGPGKGFLSSSS